MANSIINNGDYSRKPRKKITKCVCNEQNKLKSKFYSK